MFSAEIHGIRLVFETGPRLFSPNAVDRGTLAMLSAVEFSENDRVLDLGCGYGAVGIYAAKRIGEANVVMCDVSEDAAAAARDNAIRNGVSAIDIRVSDGFDRLPDGEFTLILSNPPYHTDFSVAKRFIEGGFRRLSLGGKMVMVTKRLDWYKNKLISVFGGVCVTERDGYYVFVAEKRGNLHKKKKEKGGLSRKLRKKRNSPKRKDGGA